MSVLANKYSMTVLDLALLLRQKGISTEIKPVELEYIHENIDRMPASEIREKLSLTESQFSQILKNKLLKKQRKSSTEMSLSEATSKTRWLIEEKLLFDVDDFLPRKIKDKHFKTNDLSNCLQFSNSEKKKDTIYRHFTAIAFLVCQAYPNNYRPFQFRHAKSNEYFRGVGGRKNIISATRWVIENKLGYKQESLTVIARNRYFLRSNDLRFYGISSYWFRNYFSSHEEFISAILKEYQVVQDNSRATTVKLRERLKDSGRQLKKCEVPDCYFDDEFIVEIHHIVPVAASNQIRFDINCVENLVVLCPNHHRIAGRFDWKNNLDLQKPDTWLASILHFIKKDNVVA